MPAFDGPPFHLSLSLWLGANVGFNLIPPTHGWMLVAGCDNCSLSLSHTHTHTHSGARRQPFLALVGIIQFIYSSSRRTNGSNVIRREIMDAAIFILMISSFHLFYFLSLPFFLYFSFFSLRRIGDNLVLSSKERKATDSSSGYYRSVDLCRQLRSYSSGINWHH